VLISEKHFDAFLKCRTKAYFTFSPLRPDELSHPISDWQKHIAEKYQRNCREHLRLVDGPDCFVGTPRPEDLRNGTYPLILEPLITALDAESYVHALQRGPVPTQQGCSPYIPVRFVPFERISRHHKLMLAFDAFVLWKASGQMPTKGRIIHGLRHTVLGLRLDTLIQEVKALVGKLRALLTEGSPPNPILIKHCSECEFETHCRKKVAEKDDLSLLDRLGATDRAKLNAKASLPSLNLPILSAHAAAQSVLHHAKRSTSYRSRPSQFGIARFT